MGREASSRGIDGVGCVGHLGEDRAEGDEGDESQEETVSGHGVSGSRLMSGVAHPRPEYPVRELAHPKLEYLARGPAHPSQRQGRGRKGW